MGVPTSKSFDRRRLLVHGAAGLGLLAVGGCRREPAEVLIDELVELAITRDSLRAIGRAYIDDHEPGTLDALVARLAADLKWSGKRDSRELSERMIRRIRDDFRESKTVRVRGWVLAETEARWAAVVALASPGG